MRQAERVILAQNQSRLTHNTRLRRLILATVLPFVGVVAAFGIAPDTVTEKLVLTKVVEEVALPPLPVSGDIEAAYWQEERIQRGDTVARVLTRLQVDDPDALRTLRASRDAQALYQLTPGKTIRAEVNDEGKLLALRYLAGSDLYSVDRTGEALKITRQPAQLETRILMASGEIRSSLFEAADAANISDAVAIQIADIFSTDMDFYRDLRKGDRFTVVYEASYHQGELVKTGRVVAAEFINQGKAYRAIYFQNPEGRGGYYTLDGKNIRKAFLRSPLEFSRITSGFTSARFHPVLHQWRAHKGVDYAAPLGTRVKATADGVVQFIGRQGGYGNLVVLRHQSKYTTWYGHLSRFTSGLRKGSRVSQGEVIAYVGATGLATGPHLHYEFRINDVQQNPLRVVMPSAPPITPEYRTAFEAAVQPLALRLQALRGINLAQFD